MTKFNAYRETAKGSKSESVVDSYELGNLDYKTGAASCHSIEDEYVELFCLNMPLLKMRRMKPRKAQLMRQRLTATDEQVTEPDGTVEDIADQVEVKENC